MQSLKITKDHLDSLRTNPSIEYLYSVYHCQKCREPFQFVVVRLGSQTDRAYDDIKEQLVNQAISMVSGFVETVATTVFKTSLVIAYPKARLRLEKPHFDELYNNKSVILAGRCPHCQTELVATLTKQ